MDTRSDSSFDIWSNTTIQSPGLMEDLSAGEGSVSASSSETVENHSMVGSEATMDGVERETIISKIGERGESFHVGLEAIIVNVGVTRVSSWIKTG